MTYFITKFLLGARLGPPKQVLKRHTSVLQSRPGLTAIPLVIAWSLDLETHAAVVLVQPPWRLSSNLSKWPYKLDGH